MFVGHYGPALAAKAAKKSVPLWVLFLAVQLLDVFWSIFVMLGIEKVRIVPGITATNPLDLYYMPYTHSLTAAILWSLGASVVYRSFRRGDGWLGAALVGGAVFSHWVLDLLVHRPDLALYDDTLKVGLGLWNYPVLSSALEIAFLFGGIYLYYRTTRPVTPAGRYGLLIFGLVMLVVQGLAFFGPQPSSANGAAVEALLSYLVFAGVAYWLESRRA
ncbi:MAG TPA: hypothetical protein VK776_07345 [Bryobacteraceae bacterium]|nr:hypothetical protein [Bryobacteraceae bacterium]